MKKWKWKWKWNEMRWVENEMKAISQWPYPWLRKRNEWREAGAWGSRAWVHVWAMGDVDKGLRWDPNPTTHVVRCVCTLTWSERGWPTPRWSPDWWRLEMGAHAINEARKLRMDGRQGRYIDGMMWPLFFLLHGGEM